jgi:hypothetical protein
MTTIITFIATIVGTGGITAFLTTILSARKYRAEANRLEAEAEIARRESELKQNEYINKQLKELSESHQKESEELRQQNKVLNNKINELNNKLNELMIWVVSENHAHISFLKDKIREFEPDFVFPEMKPCPNPWSDKDSSTATATTTTSTTTAAPVTSAPTEQQSINPTQS